ncbi:COG4 [Scenedesmus sp. PABB004]|nr:COG4 [Scenedesmus sp. PABB004]
MPALARAPSAALGEDEKLAALTSAADVHRLLHETVARERAIEAALDKQLARRGELQRAVAGLQAGTAEVLELARADAEQLARGVAATAAAADRIGSRVRALDAQAGAVGETLELIGLILDRTHCVSGVQQAMAAGDYDAAAGHIATFLALEARLAASGAAAAGGGADAGQAEEQRQLLLSAKAQLEGVVSQRLEDAVGARDHAAVLRFVLIHKPLAAPERGVSRYVDYMRLVLGAQARELYASLDAVLDARGGAGAPPRARGGAAKAAAAPAGVVDVLSALFRSVAMAVEADEAALVGAFGARALADVVVGVQAEVDAAGVRMLDRFLEARRVAALISDAQGRKRASPLPPGGGGGDAVAATKQVEAVIQELVLLVARSEEYFGFMSSRMAEAVAAEVASMGAPAGGAGGAARRASAPDAAKDSGGGGGGAALDPAAAALQAHLGQAEAALRSGPFAVAVRQLLGQYLALEELYLEDTTDMAIRIDEVVAGALTSSVVDDAFFILKKCGGRALATRSVQCAAAVLGQLNDLAANKLRAALAAKLGAGPGRLLAAAPALDGSGAAGGAPDAGAVGHAVAINNIDVAGEYVRKLRGELEGHAERLFPRASELDRLRSVLVDMTKTAGDFRGAAGKALEAVADGLLPRLRPILDEVGTTSYQLSESDYAGGELGGGWVMRLAVGLELQLSWLQPLLTPGCWESLALLLLDKLLTRLEVLLGRKTFTQLGGLQLDRDVRSLVAAAGELTTRPVRDKFARLTQMAIVLSLESVEEFLDYWGDDTGHITWRLTPSEVRGVLGQRPDFARDAIAALPL